MASPLFFASIFNSKVILALTTFLLGTGVVTAADFDGDGKADEFTITREAEKVARQSGVRLVNPWNESKKPPKGSGLVVRLSRTPQTFLLFDAAFFDTPSWKEGQKMARVVTKKDKSYPAWKKQVPALKADAIELGTEAGIDILLYWDARWRLFWPKEEP
ncbi:MAG: hypothetical protein ACJ8M4_12220 [Chthoniobacterales bacterium]